MATDLTLSVDLEPGDVISAANELQSQIKAMFEASAGDKTNARIDKLLLQLKNGYSSLEELLTNIADKTANLQMTPGYLSFLDSVAENDKKIIQLQEALAKSQSKLNTLYQEEALVKVTSDVGEIAMPYRMAQQEITNLVEQYRKFAQIEEYLNQNKKALQALYAEAKRTNDPTLWQQWDQLANSVKQLESEYNNLEPEMSKLEQKAEELAEAMQTTFTGPKNFSSGALNRIMRQEAHVRDLNRRLEYANELAEEFNKIEQQYTKDNTKYINPADTDAYKKDIADTEKLVDQLVIAIRQLNAEKNKSQPGSDSFSKNFAPTIVDFANNIKQLPQMIESATDQIARTLPPLAQLAYSIVKGVLKKIISEVVGAFKEAFTLVRDTIKNTLTKALQTATAAVKAFGKAVLGVASNAVLGPFKNLANSISNIGKKAQESTPSLKQIGRAFLQYGIGARSLYRLINKLRTALFEGFATLAVAYDPFNESMSRITTSLEYLKNSFAAAFAPIVEFVAPALSIFIDKMAGAVQMVGQFIAALTGKEFVMAMPVYKDYAENTKAGANAEKEAAKAAKNSAKAEKEKAKQLKEEQRTLAGFDDVEILKENKNTTSSTTPTDYDTSLPTLENATATFQVAAVQDGINQFVDLIKKAWQEVNFYDLGVLLSTKLGEALKALNEKVPQIEAFLRKVATSVATFLAGFLSVGDTFKELGKAIGNGVNLIFATIQQFLSDFIKLDGFKNLGKAIFNVIYNALKKIKWDTIFNVFANIGIGMADVLNETVAKPKLWEEVFKTLCNMLTAILLKLYTFATRLKWGDIGKAIGAGINKAIETFPFSLLAQTASKFINGIFTALRNFAVTVHWDELGKNIGNSIMLFFRSVNWKVNGQSLGMFLNGVFTTLKNIVDTINFKEVGQNILNFITGFFEKFNWRSALSTLLKLLNGLLDILITVVSGIKWQDIIKEIKEYVRTNPEVQKFIENIWTIISNYAKAKLTLKWETFKLIGTMVIKGIFEGITNWLKSVGTWIKKNIFDKIVTKIKEVFGIKSPAKKMESIGSDIIEGVFEGIKNVMKNIKDWVKEHIFDKFWDGITGAFGIVKGVAGKIVDVGKSIAGAIKNGITDKWKDIKSWVSTNVVDKAQSALNTGFNVVKGVANKVVGVGTAIGTALKSGIKNKWSDIKTWTSTNVVTPAKSALDTGFNVAKGVANKVVSTGTAIGTALKSGIKDKWSDIRNWAGTNVVTPTKTALNTGFEISRGIANKVVSVGQAVIGGVKSGISNKKSELDTKARDVGSSVETKLNQPDWARIGTGIISAIKNILSSISETRDLKDSAAALSNSIFIQLNSHNWDSISRNIINALYKGIGWWDNYKYATEAAWDLGSRIYDYIDHKSWGDIGTNIMYGIIDGMNDGWTDLSTKAWNVAVDLYNTACAALGISSPSKVFRDKVGAMIPAGISVGIDRNTTIAKDSVEGLSNDIIDTFSNTKLPPIAVGQVIPYSIGNAQTEDVIGALQKVQDMLNYNQNNSVTKDDLVEIITNAIRMFPVNFYLGDEQIARHANNGNRKLNMRYNSGQ